MNEGSRDGESFLTGLVLGVILGAGFVCFLSSTEEGRVVKKRLQKKTEDALDNLREIVEEAEEKGEELKEKATEIKRQLEKKTGERNFSSIEKLQEKGRRAIRFFTRNGKPLT